MTDTVLIDNREGVAVLTLNRPERLNALNYADRSSARNP